MTRTLDQRLEEALSAAADEAIAGGHPLSAKAFDEIRNYLIQWREVAVDRIKDLNLVVLPADQHDQLMTLLAREMVAKIMADKRLRRAEDRERMWTTRGAKIGAAVAVISLVLTVLLNVYNAFFGAAHPIHIP